jgi:hypothetical protein
LAENPAGEKFKGLQETGNVHCFRSIGFGKQIADNELEI